MSFLSGEFTGGSERTFSVMIAASSGGFCALQRARCLRSNLLCIPDLSLPLLQVSEENGLRAERKVLKEMQPKSPATVKLLLCGNFSFNQTQRALRRPP